MCVLLGFLIILASIVGGSLGAVYLGGYSDSGRLGKRMGGHGWPPTEVDKTDRAA